jgi:alpha-beta hydrolase superfamily lysophospholipase
VLIGHFAGGFVVQKYLESHDAPAGVLVASTPCRGLFRCVVRLMKRHPWLTIRMIVTGKSLPRFNRPGLAREAFFSAKTPESDVLRYTARLQEESERVGRDQLLLDLPRPKRVHTPMLVLGAADDACFSPKEVRATARAYGTEAEIFPGMGHDMMLEPGWTAVAERIDTWLGTRGL